ncbi:hypothetical protein QE373_003481 [Stenotrophomonas sp. SORGH_AS321]|nr:hypothetical protein [Stenotrophomonas sp. SORGH_AS_0321]
MLLVGDDRWSSRLSKVKPNSIARPLNFSTVIGATRALGVELRVNVGAR